MSGTFDHLYHIPRIPGAFLAHFANHVQQVVLMGTFASQVTLFVIPVVFPAHANIEADSHRTIGLVPHLRRHYNHVGFLWD
jgi:hypothetical protein